MPRRWHQACEIDLAGDGDKKARSPGRARRKPLKPIVQGRPDRSGGPVVTTLVSLLFSDARLRVRQASGFPRALFFLGATRIRRITRAFPAARPIIRVP